MSRAVGRVRCVELVRSRLSALETRIVEDVEDKILNGSVVIAWQTLLPLMSTPELVVSISMTVQWNA